MSSESVPRPARTIPVVVAPDDRELSEEALNHLRMILLHRPDLEVLSVKIMPKRCALCDEIWRWSEAVHR
jgi:hypothetical protein